jgi:hypothetical protein
MKCIKTILKKLSGWVQCFISVIPAIWEMEIRRIMVEASPGKSFKRSHLNQWLDAVEYTCHSSNVEKNNRGITVQTYQARHDLKKKKKKTCKKGLGDDSSGRAPG